MWPLISPASKAPVSSILALIMEWPVMPISALPPWASTSRNNRCEHLTSPNTEAPGRSFSTSRAYMAKTLSP